MKLVSPHYNFKGEMFHAFSYLDVFVNVEIYWSIILHFSGCFRCQTMWKYRERGNHIDKFGK